MALVTIGIGSNVGERFDHVRHAMQLISEKLGPLSDWSSIFETPPWGDPDQPDYVNAVVRVEVQMDPSQVLQTIQEIELAVGRTPTRKWGPREIDLDILLFGDLHIDQPPRLQIPHPFMNQRVFVLLPLSELDPSVAPLLDSLPEPDKASIRKVATISCADGQFAVQR